MIYRLGRLLSKFYEEERRIVKKKRMAMKVYIFPDKNAVVEKNYDKEEDIINVLERIAETSNTADLVVAIYFLENSCIWRGATYTEWFTPTDFHRYTKRIWAFIRVFDIPKDLPSQFKLIRIVLGMPARYPKTTTGRYGWRYKYSNFKDHIANVFAHELHHFRRYHLEMHPKEGEQSACKWGVEQTKKAGFFIDAKRILKQKSRKVKKKITRIPTGYNPRLLRRIKQSSAHLSQEDLEVLQVWISHRICTLIKHQKKNKRNGHFDNLKGLPKGNSVVIKFDDNCSSEYTGTTATKVKNVNGNSSNMLIKTADGKTWYWPMQWLELDNQPQSKA